MDHFVENFKAKIELFNLKTPQHAEVMQLLTKGSTPTLVVHLTKQVLGLTIKLRSDFLKDERSQPKTLKLNIIATTAVKILIKSLCIQPNLLILSYFFLMINLMINSLFTFNLSQLNKNLTFFKAKYFLGLSTPQLQTCSCPFVRYFRTLFWDDITIIRDENIVYFVN